MKNNVSSGHTNLLREWSVRILLVSKGLDLCSITHDRLIFFFSCRHVIFEHFMGIQQFLQWQNNTGANWTNNKSKICVYSRAALMRVWYYKGMFLACRVIVVGQPSQSASKMHNEERKSHIALRTSWSSQKMCLPTLTILLFWLSTKETFRMFLLHHLCFLLCSLDLDVPCAQRVIDVFLLS